MLLFEKYVLYVSHESKFYRSIISAFITKLEMRRKAEISIFQSFEHFDDVIIIHP
jgi:hypothetical protein